MEIKRTRVNYRLLGKVRSVKQNVVIDKTLYAKKLGLIKNDANLIVIDVATNKFTALRKIHKYIVDFGYTIKNEKEKIKNIFSYVYDEIKSQFLIVCDRSEYLMKMRNKTKFITEQGFIEADYVDENNLPYRVNWEHLSRVEEERNRLTRGEEYILVQNTDIEKSKKQKTTFNKIFEGLYNIMSGATFGSIEI